MRLALALMLAAAPAMAQEACPWGGAVRKVNALDIDVLVGSFEDPVLFGKVDRHPACDITLEAVRQALKRPGCSLYADRPDALGIEMVLDCLLKDSNGNPEHETVVWLSTTAIEALQGGN